MIDVLIIQIIFILLIILIVFIIAKLLVKLLMVFISGGRKQCLKQNQKKQII
jgi:hypothetical protein